jgi:hypothetical protein
LVEVVNINYLFLKVASTFQWQRTRQTEVEQALIKSSKLVVGIHVVKL